MVGKKIYVLLGQDSLSKHYFLDEKIKKRYLKGDTSSFKFFFSQDLDKRQIEEELRLVSIFPRVLVVHYAENLSGECQEVFRKFLKGLTSTVVIFDYESSYDEIKSDNFFKFLSRLKDCSVYKTKVSREEDYRDLLEALEKKNCYRAMCVLNNLLFTSISIRDFSNRLIGILVGYYLRRDKRVPSVLTEMEKRVKRGIISREILEFYIVKLCLLGKFTQFSGETRLFP